jgi:hypothetical protein
MWHFWRRCMGQRAGVAAVERHQRTERVSCQVNKALRRLVQDARGGCGRRGRSRTFSKSPLGQGKGGIGCFRAGEGRPISVRIA